MEVISDLEERRRSVRRASRSLVDAHELVAREKGFESWQALKSGVHAMTYEMNHHAMNHGAGQTLGTSESPASATNACHPERSEERVYFASGANAAGDSTDPSARENRGPQDDKAVPRPILNLTEAQLFVADIQASCDFYTGKLGFTVAFLYGDPPFYGQVTRDHARLNLRVVGEPVFVGDIREREHLLSATLTVATKDEIKQLFLSYQAAGVRFHQTLKKELWGARTFVVLDPDGNLILFAAPAD